MDEKPASGGGGGIGIGTMLLGAVLIAGTFVVLQRFQAKPPPPPPPDPEPTASTDKLSKPNTLPGPAKKVDPPPGDSLSMVKASKDYGGLPAVGPMANSPPEPPYVYQSDGGPDRLETKVVRRKSEWDAIWKGLGGHDMPAIDFEKYMGLVIFGGKRPTGTNIDIVSHKAEGGRVILQYRFVKPEIPALGFEHPVKAVLVLRLPTAPQFKEVK